jgi:FAD/FMN-containing dehydrogenase
VTGSIDAELEDAVGAAHATAGVAQDDVSGRVLGTPRRVVRPATTDEVARVVRICRAHRQPIAIVGERTAYWQPLDVEGCVVIAPARLDAITPSDEAWIVGAGASVRAVDRALRHEGLRLPIHPDAFGETSIGAMVATACTSGIGMGSGSIDDAVLGLEVVLGSGDVVRTGAMANASVPFVRAAIPDATGLFVGAQGALGVITRVALARRDAEHRVHLSARVDATRALITLGRAWAGIYDTFRATRGFDERDTGAFDVDVWVVSPVSATEARARAEAAVRALESIGARDVALTAETDAARGGRSPEYDARFLGPGDGHAAFRARGALVGLDVNTPYASADALVAIATDLATEQRRRGVPHTRVALYLAPELVNVGVHATVPAGVAYEPRDLEPFAHAMAAHPIVPYRAGRTWPASTRSAPSEWMRAMRALCDPDDLLSRGHPSWT